MSRFLSSRAVRRALRPLYAGMSRMKNSSPARAINTAPVYDLEAPMLFGQEFGSVKYELGVEIKLAAGQGRHPVKVDVGHAVRAGEGGQLAGDGGVSIGQGADVESIVAGLGGE